MELYTVAWQVILEPVYIWHYVIHGCPHYWWHLITRFLCFDLPSSLQSVWIRMRCYRELRAHVYKQIDSDGAYGLASENTKSSWHGSPFAVDCAVDGAHHCCIGSACPKARYVRLDLCIRCYIPQWVVSTHTKSRELVCSHVSCVPGPWTCAISHYCCTPATLVEVRVYAYLI